MHHGADNAGARHVAHAGEVFIPNRAKHLHVRELCNQLIWQLPKRFNHVVVFPGIRAHHPFVYRQRRARVVARPRQVAMWLAKQITTRSLPDIGRRFGGRDHPTVLHAERRIEALKAEDPMIARDLDVLLRKLRG